MMRIRWNRIALAAMLIVGFFVILKPVRMMLVHEVVVPAALSLQSDPSDFELRPSRSVAYHVLDLQNPQQRRSQWFAYTGFGNFYFLVGALILVLLGHRWARVLHLYVLHLVLSIVAAWFLAIGLWANSMHWLHAMDFTVTVATPAATGIFVLWVTKGGGKGD